MSGDSLVDRVADLARLAIGLEEKARMEAQFADILRYVESLRRLPTEGVEPMVYPTDLADVFRADEVAASFPKEETLANAPDPQGDFFGVPKVVEG